MHLPEHIAGYLAEIECDENISSRQEAIEAIRPLGLCDFARVLWAMPSEAHPRLSNLLPPMTPSDITKRWTGTTGEALLLQGLEFVNNCGNHYGILSKSDLMNKRILDFGCGYGRFLRLFSFFSDSVFGVDAWDHSLEFCRIAGMGDMVAKSDVIPEGLPYDGKYDFACAYSVFTHLSQRAFTNCLMALRRSAHESSILAITVRPIEFWEHTLKGRLKQHESELERCIEQHRTTGFAFFQTEHEQSAGDYGTTTMSIDWLEDNLSGWKVAMTDTSIESMQRYVFLKPV